MQAKQMSPEHFPDYYVRQEDGSYRMRTSAEREAYRRSVADNRRLVAELARRLSDDSGERNHFRERAADIRKEADGLITPQRRGELLRRAKTFDSLAVQRDVEIAKAECQRQRESSPAFRRMKENADSLASAFEYVYPNGDVTLRDQLLAIAASELPVDQATEKYWAIVRRLEQAEANALAAASREADEQSAKADRDAAAARLVAAKRQQQADTAGESNE